jgi:hypothetical protein
VTPEEQDYAVTLAGAIADDLLANPPGGALVRVVVRWFEEDDPLYFTIHALGADEHGEVPSDDAWYPLEWPNSERELERADRLLAHPGVKRTGEALTAVYSDDEDDEDGEWGPSAATVEVVRRLPDALRSAGVPLADEFSASAAHFEGWGALSVLQKVADPDLIAALEARGELPGE